MPSLPRADSGTLVHVVRQAVLDAQGHVVGYELLYRGAIRDHGGTADAEVAGARLLANAVLDLRLDALTDGRPAFINLTRSMLVNGAATLLRPPVAVFEVKENLAIDAEVVDACRGLSEAGYRLALDGFTSGSPAEALLPCAAYVVFDIAHVARPDVVALARQLTGDGLQVMARNVETLEDHEWSRAAGCTLFQGRFFHRPETRLGRILPLHATHLRLLSALNRPRLTVDELEDLVKQDAVLSLRVLQCINSAAFAIRREVRSIREALVLLGMGPIRKWASVWCLAKLNGGCTTELASVALIRARTGELLAEAVEGVDPNEMFLVGLCSVLDAMLGRPRADAIADLPLSPAARAALLGEASPLGCVLEAVTAYERASWDLAADAVQAAGASEAALTRAYASALSWARELSATSLSA